MIFIWYLLQDMYRYVPGFVTCMLCLLSQTVVVLITLPLFYIFGVIILLLLLLIRISRHSRLLTCYWVVVGWLIFLGRHVSKLTVTCMRRLCNATIYSRLTKRNKTYQFSDPNKAAVTQWSWIDKSLITGRNNIFRYWRDPIEILKP